MTATTVKDLESAKYWITRCVKITRGVPYYCGYDNNDILMMAMESSTAYILIKEKLLTSRHKKDEEELNIQLALGILDESEIVLIPTAAAFLLYPESKAYRNMQEYCVQL